MKNSFTLPGLAVLLLFSACNKEAEFTATYYEAGDYELLSTYLQLPALPHSYQAKLPEHLTMSSLFPVPVDDAQATLGRVLFYDKNLSKDGTVSCAGCHDQSRGFADNAVLSRGVFDRQTSRNSLALGSVVIFSAYYGTDLNGPSAVPFFWDNRAGTTADQTTSALTNDREMGMKMSEVTAMVGAQPYYKPLFKKAFKDESVTQERVLEAIGAFINSIGSYNSRFDREAASFVKNQGNVYALPSQDFQGFTTQENRGKRLYMDNCASCHSTVMGRPMLLEANNGLDAQTLDPGVGAITGRSDQLGSFKVPTLRNIALTAPYMHDGRFPTLLHVVEHYSSGVQDHPNLHSNLRQGGLPKRLNLTQSDKVALIAFLETLTDETQAIDPRFSDPFR